MPFNTDFDNIYNESLNILKHNGSILYPTETVWGIGCDATSDKAVENIYKIKERSADKSLIILVSSILMLKEYITSLNKNAIYILETFPKPLTIIYPNAKGLAKNVCHANGSVAIRVIKHAFCKELISAFKKPIVSTSANISGHTSPVSFNSISQEILNRVDYIVNLPNFVGSGIPSTIAKFDNNDKLIIVRP